MLLTPRVGPVSEGHRGSSPQPHRHCAPFFSSALSVQVPISPPRQSLLCTVVVQMFHIIFKQMTAERIWIPPPQPVLPLCPHHQQRSTCRTVPMDHPASLTTHCHVSWCSSWVLVLADSH